MNQHEWQPQPASLVARIRAAIERKKAAENARDKRRNGNG